MHIPRILQTLHNAMKNCPPFPRSPRFLRALSKPTAALATVLLYSFLPSQVSAGAAPQQPNTNGANDYLIDALRLDINGRYSITTSSYTTEADEPASDGFKTAWFTWTAPNDPPQTVRFETYGSGYDTVISIYKQQPGTATLISSLTPVTGSPENPVNTDNDPALPAVSTGYLTWTPQPNTTYYIVVGGSSNTGGKLETTFGGVLAADGTTSLVPNDNLASPQEFTAIVTTASQIPTGTLNPGSTISATAESGEQNLPGNGANTPSVPKGGTVWYKYKTGASAQVFTIELTDVPQDMAGKVILQCFDNTNAPNPPNFATLHFDDQDTTSSLTGCPRLVVNASANTEYYFRVTSTDGQGVQYNIRLDAPSTVPPNDAISNAIDLQSTLPSIRNQGDNNYNATMGANFDGMSNGVNVWYRWKAPATGMVRLRSLAPTANTTVGNQVPDSSTFKFDCYVYYDTSNPTDTVFDTSTRQNIAGFTNQQTQSTSFFALKDVEYFIEIGGDVTQHSSGCGYIGFVLEDGRLSAIAHSGVSYGPEGVLNSLSLPVVNKTGDVAFQSSFFLGGPVTAANGNGIFCWNGSSTTVAAVQGDSPFATPVRLGTFSNLFLTDRTTGGDTAPDIGFNATLTGTGNTVLPSSTSAMLAHIDTTRTGAQDIRLGDYLGTSNTWGFGGGYLASINTPVRQTKSDVALFTGSMAGIPIYRNTGIFAAPAKVIVQEEDPAPNTTDGVEFGDFGGTLTLNSTNNMAFRATLRGTGVTSKNDQAVYSVNAYNGTSNALNYRLRLRKGIAAPGRAGSSLAGGATLFSLGDPRMNTNGKMVVMASFTPGTGAPAVQLANSSAILSDLVSADQSFAIVARAGDTPGGPNGTQLALTTYTTFLPPFLITNNAVIFMAKIAGQGVTSANNTGIWLWDGYRTYLIARSGGSAPGVLTQVGNTFVQAAFGTLSAPIANPNGRVAFIATLTGTGITSTNNAGLWEVEDDGITPVLRLRKGENYNFGVPELPIYRTINSISYTAGSGGDDGFPRAMDQDGNIAVLVGLSKAGVPQGTAIFRVSP